MAEDNGKTQQPEHGKRKKDERLTLHPRSFADAVREIWGAEPPKKDEGNQEPDKAG